MEKLPGEKAMNDTAMKTGHFCIPRRVPIMRGSNNSNTLCNPGRSSNKRLSPMSLLERFREAVFRLIMLTALSKATAGGGGGQAAVSFSNLPPQRTYYYPSPHDPHHSEAVAECIEFIKKKSAPMMMDETDDDDGLMADSCFDEDQRVQYEDSNSELFSGILVDNNVALLD